MLKRRLSIWIGLAATLLLVPIEGSAAAKVQADGNRTVSSDGSIVAPSTSVYRSFSRSQRPKRTAHDAGRFDTAEEAERLSRLAPTVAPMGIESIIGEDDRVRIDDTETFPASATVLVTFDNGFCSGWMIGADTVATAGHCVHTGGSGGSWQTNVVVYPGRNGDYSPYGSCSARTLYSVIGWTQSSDDRYDYGAIKLNCSVGNSTGWYGFFWQSASLDGLPTIINGYPGDKWDGGNWYEQWQSFDEVRVTEPRRVFYQNDTWAGMSGSPVYYDRPGCGYCSMAIHAYGTYNGWPFSDYNHGPRIVQAVFNNLLAWRNAP